MITPEQIDFLSLQLGPIWEDFEIFVIQDITRRIKGALDNQMTGSAELQVSAGAEYGIDTNKISAALKKALGRSDQAVYNILQESGLLNILQTNENLPDGITPISVDDHPELATFVNEAIQQTQGELHNFTQSGGFAVQTPSGIQFQPIAQFYKKQLDQALFNVSAGVIDQVQAARTVVENMSASGLQFVDYASGWRNRADVAVRRSLLTGLNQMTASSNKTIADAIGTDLVEVTAHMGARPSHKLWQGKIFSLRGDTPGYKTLADGTGYGTGPGLMGWNCRHNYNPYVEGSPHTWSDEELENIDPPDFEYNGRTYSCYEATQRQRQLETRMRAVKREITGYETAGDKEALQLASHKLKELKSEYSQFSKDAGLKERMNRAQVISYDQSMSMKAHWANINYMKGIK